MTERFEAHLADAERGIELGRLLAQASRRLYDYGPDEVVPSELREEIQTELDILWPEDFTECLFSGWANITRCATEITETTDYIENGHGFSDGFWVSRFGRKPKGSWQVGLGFNRYADETDDLHYVVNLQQTYGIVPVAELERALPKIPTVHQILSARSEALAAVLADPEFLGLNLAEQKHVVRRELATAQEKCAKYGHPLSGVPIVLDAESGYALVCADTTDGTQAEYRRFELQDLVLSGSCLTIDSLVANRLNRQQPIEQSDQLVDASAGICLMFEPDETSLRSINDHNAIKLAAGMTLAVPVSGQNLEVVFTADMTDTVRRSDF